MQDEPTSPSEEWISVHQAAKRLGIAYTTVLSRAVSGKLETTRFGGRTFVSRASVERALSGQPA